MFHLRLTLALSTAAVLSLVTGSAALAGAGVTLTQVSSDPFTNSTSQHRTEVEPDTLAAGSTIVSAFQQGRFFDGGASDVGFATSTDGGKTYTSGSLPGTTTFSSPAGPYDRATDPSVAFDARHNVWLISWLGIHAVNPAVENSFLIDVLVSRSTDGGLTWSGPIAVDAPGNLFLDKNWTVCDNSVSSPFFGNCYTEFDNFSANDLVLMSTSTDGGLTWGAAQATADHALGLGGQPLVQANGTVIVPIVNAFETTMLAFTSSNGGASWNKTVVISSVRAHRVVGMRASPLPSAEIDGSGRVYTVWQDCRFRRACSANDIVLSSSTDGVHWSNVSRVPIDAVTSGMDHFIPGIGVDRSTADGSTGIGLTYYFYPVAACSSGTCQLDLGYISSTNGGSSWSAPIQLAGPMSLSWLPNTNQGAMVGDYIATSILGGLAQTVVPVASAPRGGLLQEPMVTPKGGLAIVGGATTDASAEASTNSDFTAATAATAN
jgi:hypothetical protein